MVQKVLCHEHVSNKITSILMFQFFWVIGSWHSLRSPCCFKMQETDYPRKQCLIPKEWNPQHHHCKHPETEYKFYHNSSPPLTNSGPHNAPSNVRIQQILSWNCQCHIYRKTNLCSWAHENMYLACVDLTADTLVLLLLHYKN